MSKQSLLLVDGDTRSLRVLEVSLRKAGFTVTPAASVKDALDKLELDIPDLIISETTFSTDVDGFELRRKLRGAPDWAEIPFVFLTAETAIENKIRGLELGVDDYLTKPIYIKEIVTRINILLQKRQRAHFDERKDGMRFAGRVADMPVVDVIQTIEVSRKSGVIQFVGERQNQAAIYFRDGKVIDAEAGTLQAEDAVYRLLTWNDGEFEVVFRTVRRRETIAMSSQGLLMEGMRRLDEWSRLLEQLPPLTHRFEIDTAELAMRLGDVPDDNNRILRLIDGKRPLLEVIDASDFGDLECLQAISRLYFEGMLHDLDPNVRPRRDTGRPMPLVIVEAPTPIEEVVSGPIAVGSLASRSALPSASPSVLYDEITDDDVADPGPLMGGYRPSSLRLIDEAVAAAQAIEPSLFTKEADDTALIMTVEVDERKVDEAVPSEIAADEPRYDIDGERIEPPRPQSLPQMPAPRREDSSLRMIGSHGRDRAEASGELGSTSEPSPLSEESQRELVTIMPRRNTRDIAVIAAAVSQEIGASVASGAPVADIIVGSPAVEDAQEPPAEPVAPVPPREDPTPPRSPLTDDDDMPMPRAVSLWPRVLLLIAAAIVVGGVVFMYVRTTHSKPVLGPPASERQTSREIVANTVAPVALVIDAGPPALDAQMAAPDAAVAVVVPAVAMPPRDAGSAVEPVVDRARQARELADRAHAALEDGDPAKALALADASLKLRKVARTYLDRARALQRLARIEDAIASVDSALAMTTNYAPAYEQRALILWSARRYEEAKAAMQKYLALEPDGKTSSLFHRMIEEPR